MLPSFAPEKSSSAYAIAGFLRQPCCSQLILSLALLGSAPTGQVGVGELDVVIVSLTSLSIFLVPLIALLIAHDAIVGEAERGTLPLLLSYPVRRWQVIVGKFCGHVLILLFATIIGYGAAALALAD